MDLSVLDLLERPDALQRVPAKLAIDRSHEVVQSVQPLLQRLDGGPVHAEFQHWTRRAGRSRLAENRYSHRCGRPDASQPSPCSVRHRHPPFPMRARARLLVSDSSLLDAYRPLEVVSLRGSTTGNLTGLVPVGPRTHGVAGGGQVCWQAAWVSIRPLFNFTFHSLLLTMGDARPLPGGLE